MLTDEPALRTSHPRAHLVRASGRRERTSTPRSNMASLSRLPADGWRAEAMAILGNFQPVRTPCANAGHHAATSRRRSIQSSPSFERDLARHPCRASSSNAHERLSTSRTASSVGTRRKKPVVVNARSRRAGASTEAPRDRDRLHRLPPVDVEPVQGVHFAATGELLTPSFADQALSLAAGLARSGSFSSRRSARRSRLSVAPGQRRTRRRRHVARTDPWWL